jgi:hypothetical protein
MSTTLLQDEAVRIVAAAAAAGVELRLLGGIAIQLRCNSVAHRSLTRTAGDVDFCVLASDVPRLEPLFVAAGYEPWLPFNRLNAQNSQRFDRQDGTFSVDVFVDQLRMCHTLDFRGRLGLEPLTLPLADLLLSKAQIVELTEKDMQDAIALLRDHDLGGPGEPDRIDLDRVVSVCADDWGWYRTVTGSLEKTRAAADRLLDGEVAVGERIDRLSRAIEEAPKSRRWKLRARVGERKRWYEEPEMPERKA